MGRFEIERAEHAGACYGVQRALDLANQAALIDETVCALGPLIHNPRVVEDLKQRGIGVAQSADEVKTQAVIIRSHGVVPEVIEGLLDRDIEVIDATCPYVLRAHRAAEYLSGQVKTVLVIGEEGHPEVEGILAHAKRGTSKALVVGQVEDIPDDLEGPVGIVVQTTQSPQKLSIITQELSRRGIEYLIKDTICSATMQRQKAARDLARMVDVMIVVGGRNSSNTTRLFELCQQCCDLVYHIEGIEEIDPVWFKSIKRVGVTAGASTPENQIQAVISYLEQLSAE